MSRTKRFNEKKIEPKRGDINFMGEVYKDTTPEWKRERDKKRRSKSSSSFKRVQEAKRRAARKQEIKKVQKGHVDPDNLPVVKEPKENDWIWN